MLSHVPQESTEKLMITITLSAFTLFASAVIRHSIKLTYLVSMIMSFYTLRMYKRVSGVLYMDAQTAEIRGRLKVRLTAMAARVRVLIASLFD